MLKAELKYGAIKAKVMAMVGKMLTEDEFDSLGKCTDLTELGNVLSNKRGWSDNISKLPSPLTAFELKEAIRETIPGDIRKIERFSDKRDKDFLRLLTHKSEYELILTALRRLSLQDVQKNSGRVEKLSLFVDSKASDYASAIENSESWDELLEIVSGSIYANALRMLDPNIQTGLPAYDKATVLLESTYNNEIFSFAAKKYRGRLGAPLRELLGRQADWLNVVSLLRLHRYFRNSLQTAGRLLIPISYKLGLELRKAVMDARNEAEAVKILRHNGFQLDSANLGNEALESVFEKSMSVFCHKFVKVTEPGAATAPAYLVLKDIESRRLLRIIEAIES